jgi:pimeloyl-ACP methyl ester carboxylesterase
VAVELSDRVQDWQSRGEAQTVLGHQIHTLRQDGESPCLLLLHGVPSSSYDWRRLADVEDRQAVLTFDFLGFGLSDKPRGHDYSLQEQTDLAEELVERYVGSDPYFIVAHDLGTSVATELMARDIDGRLRGNVSGALLLNGSIILERARRRAGMKILRGPLGPVMARAMTGRFYRRQFDALFSPDHPPEAGEAEDQWALIEHGGGKRITHTFPYMDDRERYSERWRGAFRDWDKPLSLVWGMLDTLALPAVLEGLRELRPDAHVTELPDVGHNPQIEVPEQVAAAIRGALDRSGVGT